MPRLLFWNYRHDGPDAEDLLSRLVVEEGVDLVILAESRLDPDTFVRQLSRRGRNFVSMPIPHHLIQIYSGYPANCFLDEVRDQARLCLRRFQAPGCQDILIAAVHLTSGLYLERSERKAESDPLARTIREVQREFEHARIIVVGDFNLNPFDEGMINSEGFGAMMTKRLVKKFADQAEDRFERLYNPMWSRFGLEPSEGPPGTYYWPARRHHNIYWNYLDQVLVGHDLLDHFPDSQFWIITSIPGPEERISLVRETDWHWKIDVSDHLPLIFDLDLPGESPHV